MIVDDLTKGLRNKIEEIFSIKNSLSILNVPKQKLLERGNLIILLDDNNKPIIVEFVKSGKYHLELKNTSFPKLLVESIFKSDSTQLFETTNFDIEFDNDYYINYNKLTPNEKNDLKTFIKHAENKLINEHMRFGTMCKDSLNKTINIQNGIFTVWMKENGFEIPNNECLKVAYKEAVESNDIQLKKRAAAAKCYHKIYSEKLNAKK